MKVQTVEVSGIKWVTHMDGLIKPIVKLKKMYKGPTFTYDGIALKDANLIQKHEMYVGKRLKVKLTNDSVKVLDLKAKQPYIAKKEFLPISADKCPACGSDVEHNHCVNDYCIAKSRSVLYRFFDVYDRKDVGFYNEYLNNFRPTASDQPVKIDTLIELLFFFEKIKASLNTTGRLACLHKKEHEEFELKVFNGFKNITPHQFWGNIGIWNLKESALEKLGNIDPFLLLNDKKEFDAKMHEHFKGDVDNAILIRDILHSERGLVRMLKALDAITK